MVEVEYLILTGMICFLLGFFIALAIHYKEQDNVK